MKERPILFSSSMVRAILDGSKTQTRRVVKQDREGLLDCEPHPAWDAFWQCVACPYGKPGDRLWVRETFAIVPRTAYARSDGVQQTLRPDDDHDAAIYRAGWDRSNGGFRWRPSIHMPRWASRILLEIADVRVERLQDISEADAKAEGAHNHKYNGLDLAYARAYSDLWESINGPDSWAANPWVWVVEFRRIEP